MSHVILRIRMTEMVKTPLDHMISLCVLVLSMRIAAKPQVRDSAQPPREWVDPVPDSTLDFGTAG